MSRCGRDGEERERGRECGGSWGLGALDAVVCAFA